MKKKVRLHYRAVLSLILSAVLFCMPAAAFSMNGNNAIEVMAEEENDADRETENSTEGQPESGEGEETGDSTVSGNDIEPVCTCEDKCGAYEYDRNCKVCVEDYRLCAYKSPNVSISINKPEGWFNDTVAVTFQVADMAHTGNFEVMKMQAKVGQNGSWTDVTEERKD